jgi:hypothetical protein
LGVEIGRPQFKASLGKEKLSRTVSKNKLDVVVCAYNLSYVVGIGKQPALGKKLEILSKK